MLGWKSWLVGTFPVVYLQYHYPTWGSSTLDPLHHPITSTQVLLPALTLTSTGNWWAPGELLVSWWPKTHLGLPLREGVEQMLEQKKHRCGAISWRGCHQVLGMCLEEEIIFHLNATLSQITAMYSLEDKRGLLLVKPYLLAFTYNLKCHLLDCSLNYNTKQKYIPPHTVTLKLTPKTIHNLGTQREP